MVNVADFFYKLDEEFPEVHKEYTRKFDTPAQLPIYGGITCERKPFFRCEFPNKVSYLLTEVIGCQGYEVKKYNINDNYSELRLISREKDSRKIFFHVIQDLVDSVSSEKSSISIIFDRLAMWTRFFKKTLNGVLSRENEIGLWGELIFIQDQLERNHFEIVNAWKGPEAASKDFIFDFFAVEIKSSIQSDKHTIRISNENQLDATGFEDLYLFYNLLSEDPMDGKTLPELIEEITQELKPYPYLLNSFDSLLFNSGYNQLFSDKYTMGYIRQRGIAFHVRDSFPCIIPRMLPKGIKNVSYTIDLTFCSSFEETNHLIDNLERYYS